jgi:hypothetical protein
MHYTSNNTKAANPCFCIGSQNGADKCPCMLNNDRQEQCLHDACPECHGSGMKVNGGGACIHGISCPCPKCSFT